MLLSRTRVPVFFYYNFIPDQLKAVQVNKRPGFHVKSCAPETTCLLCAKKRNDNGTPKKYRFFDVSMNTHFQRTRLQPLKQAESACFNGRCRVLWKRIFTEKLRKIDPSWSIFRNFTCKIYAINFLKMPFFDLIF